MSISASTWAWRQQVLPTAKLVLLCLADHADDKGRCWPSLARICDKTGLSKSTVSESLMNLEKQGALSRKRSRGGAIHPTTYLLNCSTAGQMDAYQLSAERTVRETNCSPAGPELSGSRTSTVRQPDMNHQRTASEPSTISASGDAVGDEVIKNTVAVRKSGEGYRTKKGKILTGEQLLWFEEFWTIFDFRKGRAEAADAWLDLKVTPDALPKILEGARREASTRTRPGERGPSPKWPQGWLSGRRWEDEPSPGSSSDKRSPMRRELRDLD